VNRGRRAKGLGWGDVERGGGKECKGGDMRGIETETRNGR